MKVLVLGCGPAGLLATYAAEQFSGTGVIIVSVKRPSPLHGCQFLHEPIAGLDSEQRLITYSLRGTTEQYAQKVYGTERPPVVVSPQLYQGERPAWDLRSIYQRLYQRYEELIVDAQITPFLVTQLLKDFEADVVLSTIPRPILCQKGEDHKFTSQRCWALGDAPELGQLSPIACPPETVICDGTRDVGWYRLSNVFGYTTVEWSGLQRKPPISGIVSFDKPVSTTCDCWPGIHFIGRYGRWEKGILAHHAFSDAVNYLQAVQQQIGEMEVGP